MTNRVPPPPGGKLPNKVVGPPRTPLELAQPRGQIGPEGPTSSTPGARQNRDPRTGTRR
jgi:hypothetical protein